MLPESSFILRCKSEFEEVETNTITVELHETLPQPSRQNLSPLEIQQIESATIGQMDNEKWKEYRKGRITASNFYRVYTRTETLKRHGGDASKLVESLTGLSSPPENLGALKYGRNMESAAKQKFIKVFQNEHKNTQYKECGFFIHEEKQFIGATPDLVKCSCCGNGVVEIKCLYSIVNENPSSQNLAYLVSDGDSVTLKENHAYFCQIQGQMAVTKRNWSYFFLFTQKKKHIQKIHFNQTYWKKIEENLTWFHKNYLI